jgi:small subunit ribosomal protein S2
MKPFIYGAKNNIYIIDLAKTATQIASAYEALKTIVTNGGKVLFVGTKKQIAATVAEQANRSGSFYVNSRWLGGTLTNFSCIQKRLKYLKDLERQDEEGLLSLRTKKEASIIRKEMEKLKKNLDGIKEMRKVPEAMIIVDPSVEYNAIREANRLHIPVFAIVDTNSDPDNVNYVIPGNDDAVKSVKLLLSILADAVVEAKGGMPEVAHAKVSEEDVTMIDATGVVSDGSVTFAMPYYKPDNGTYAYLGKYMSQLLLVTNMPKITGALATIRYIKNTDYLK